MAFLTLILDCFPTLPQKKGFIHFKEDSQGALQELEIGRDPHRDDRLVTRRVRILLKLIILSVIKAIQSEEVVYIALLI